MMKNDGKDENHDNANLTLDSYFYISKFPQIQQKYSLLYGLLCRWQLKTNDTRARKSGSVTIITGVPYRSYVTRLFYFFSVSTRDNISDCYPVCHVG